MGRTQVSWVATPLAPKITDVTLRRGQIGDDVSPRVESLVWVGGTVRMTVSQV